MSVLLVNIDGQPVCTLVKRQPEQVCNHQVEIEPGVSELRFRPGRFPAEFGCVNNFPNRTGEGPRRNRPGQAFASFSNAISEIIPTLKTGGYRHDLHQVTLSAGDA